MKNISRLILIPLLALAGLTLSAQVMELTPSQKLRAAERIINSFYVEDVDDAELATEAIKAMLKTLDPHSSYTTPDETKEFTAPLEGKFSGIGITFNMPEDTVYVIQTITGGPSQKAGLLPGDRIIAANDTVLAGRKMKNSEVMKHLRGPEGTEVRLQVKRGEELIDFNLVRAEIPIYSVDETFMADPTTGYIAVSRFGESTAQEVKGAIKALKKKGMKNLIIDLSGNGGGYLGAAFDMAGEFLPKNTPVVSTSGRAVAPQTFVTEEQGDFLDGRVVVIANQYTASAAEILSGALQDNDRGLVVGRRTFGKGLVQRPFPFPDGSMIRLTTSRYYTPSGRCIQKPYEKGKSEEYQLDLLNRMASGELWHADSIPQPDSLRYETLRKHRPVYGGGGITPDVFVPVDTTYYSPYYRDLMAKAVVNRTVVNYVDKNRSELLKKYPTEEAFYGGFVLPDEVVQAMIERATEAGVSFKADEWERSAPLVRAVLKGLICRDLYEKGSYYRAVAPLNKDYTEALRLINDPERYNKLLGN
ncbi:MAG: S41 family peptidase [Muribaculaceae bacterium]|nr:S41 family peptidase [Muribaculaceae bacterium]